MSAAVMPPDRFPQLPAVPPRHELERAAAELEVRRRRPADEQLAAANVAAFLRDLAELR
jgi:hypothetical protein